MSEHWTEILNDKSFVKLSELKDWLHLRKAYELHQLVKNGFPLPRFGGSVTGRLTSTARWLVGDVRAWLNGEKQDPLNSAYIAQLRARRDALGRIKARFSSKAQKAYARGKR